MTAFGRSRGNDSANRILKQHQKQMQFESISALVWYFQYYQNLNFNGYVLLDFVK